MSVYNPIPISPEIQEQLATVGSISANLTTILEELMNYGTDIRSQKALMKQIAQGLADQAAQITEQGAKVLTIETSMVIEKAFTVAKAAFAKVGAYWTYDLQHDMNSETPSAEIYDADNDLQNVQTIAISTNVLRLELSEDEYNENSFPFEVAIKAKNKPVSALTTHPVPGTPFIVRYNALSRNGTVERSDDGGATWIPVNDAEGVASGYIAPDGQIHIALKDGMFYNSPVVNGSWNGSNSGNYSQLATMQGAVAL